MSVGAWIAAGAVGLALVWGSAKLVETYNARLRLAQVATTDALVQLRQAQTRAEIATEAADSLTRLARGDSVARERDRVALVAAAQRTTQFHNAYLAEAVAAADTCKAVIAAADSAIASVHVEAVSARQLAVTATDEANHWHLAYDTTNRALMSLEAASRKVDTVVVQLQKAARGSFVQRLAHLPIVPYMVGGLVGFSLRGSL